MAILLQPLNPGYGSVIEAQRLRILSVYIEIITYFRLKTLSAHYSTKIQLHICSSRHMLLLLMIK